MWIQPSDWWTNVIRVTPSEIGESRDLRLAARMDHVTALLAIGPDLAIHGFMAILGVLLFVLWCWVRGRELLLFGAFLLAMALHRIQPALTALSVIALPWRLGGIIYWLVTIGQMIMMIELVWAIHSLRARVLKRVLQVTLVIGNVAMLTFALATAYSPMLEWLESAAWASFQA